MRGTVAKALRAEAAAQQRPVKQLKRVWRRLNRHERAKQSAVLAIYRAARERLRREFVENGKH